MNLVLPIGISFYTFETITYVVDVYRGAHKPMSRFWDYQLYILLFPKLIAGPIIQYHDFASQVAGHTDNETSENILRGFYRFCIGLGKKVLIANVVGSAADEIFALGENLGTVTAWIGAVSYSFQIYFDFSGYSDMAIGMGRMMGFRFPENFDSPYCATSITGFWRKWHITLGAWMRNYLYIPLGGNRVNTRTRLYFNLWLVFLLSGLWHGAAWGFIIWGAYHGVFLVLERMFLGRFLTRLGKWAVLYTFPVVVIGWVFFRAEHFAPAMRYFETLFVYRPDSMYWRPDTEFMVVAAISCMFSFFALTRVGLKVQDKIFFGQYTLRLHYLISFTCIVILLLSAGRITTSTFNPFIYFRF
ncbi:MAG: MBOAT family protein [Taibaiella sp.]|nr:MBOAT family protein [Taibaiella sp.]